jgi:hypothetical protein
MDLAKQKLKERDIFYRSILINRNQTLPLEDQSIDANCKFLLIRTPLSIE